MYPQIISSHCFRSRHGRQIAKESTLFSTLQYFVYVMICLQKPVPLQRNGSGRRSWPVRTYEYVNFSRDKLKMPDIESFVHNGNLPHPEKIFGEENAVLRNWNPRALVRALYEVSESSIQYSR